MPSLRRALSRALRAPITRPTELRGLQISVGASIGVARFPQDAADPAALLDAADAAMCEAKRRGRNEIGHGGHQADRERDREREEQRALLREYGGVTAAQGFLLGRPVPAVELHERLLASPPSQLQRTPLARAA
ncbi:MAG TPA: diguanylate cyclase [Solirubrobacteraceae bacterium]|nr:diguanylate cyclase [Solirubrobacteraceae bacterium]